MTREHPKAVRFLLLCLSALICAPTLHAAPEPHSKLDPQLRLIRSASTAQRRARMQTMSVSPDGPVPTVNVLIRTAPGTTRRDLERAFPQAVFRTAIADVVTARVPIAGLDALAQDPRVRRVEHSHKYAPTMDVVRSNASSSGLFLGTLQTGAADLSGLDGSGVIVGAVDSGIDWSHPDFINSDNSSRLLYLWDQTIAADGVAPVPTGFTFGYSCTAPSQDYCGAEYTKAQITSRLQNGTPAIRESDTDGHGTHVMGIAAGNGSGTGNGVAAGTYTGMAPKADLIMVKTTFDNVAILDGINYIVSRAQALGKRAVVNLSLGGQSGPHDGTDGFETAVAAFAATTPIAVAMGNDNDSFPHARLDFNGGLGQSQTVSVNALNTGTNTFYDVEFWHPSGDGYTATVTLTCNVAGCSQSAVRTSGAADQSFTIGDTSVFLSNATSGNGSGSSQIFIEVHDPDLHVLSISVQLQRSANAGSGRVDGYTDPSIVGTFFSDHRDAAGTLGVPATAANVFAVGAYISKNQWAKLGGGTNTSFSSEPLGHIAGFSGLGPTRDGRVKPELAAPGEFLASSLSTADTVSAGNTAPDGRHFINAGTSMAAPVAAGFLALKLQASPAATVAQLHTAVQANARSDAQVGAVPNNTWGYGKLFAPAGVSAGPIGIAAATLGTSSLAWTWSSVGNAVSYNVYYATNTAVRIAGVASTSFTFTGLPANFLTSIQIKGVSAFGAMGPGSTAPSTATLALPITGSPAVSAAISSVTAAYTPCPASPAAASCSGYLLSASTAPDFSGAVFSSATPNRALAALQVSGLAPLTTYYLRLATLSASGGANPKAIPLALTSTFLAAPLVSAFSDISASAIRFNWAQGANPSGQSYAAEVSTAPGSSTPLATVSGPSLFTALFSGLSANTSYYFRVRALGGPTASTGPVSTLALPPAAAAQTFTGVTQGGLTVNWGLGGDPAGTLFESQLSTAADFSGAVASSRTLELSASYAGLSSNTTYYARVQAIGHSGAATAFAAAASTSTLAQAVSPLAFSGQSSSGFTASFTSAGNAPGTRYLAQVSTAADFSVPGASSATAAAEASFSGLASNSVYHFRVAAINNGGALTAFSSSLSTATLPAPPSAAALLSASHTISGLRFFWSRGGNAPGTVYAAVVSSDPAFGAPAASSTTANLFADFAGLEANTTYFLGARALSLAPPNPDGPSAALGGASTLADPPSAAATTFVTVTLTSVTVQWTPLPASPPQAAAEGYRLEASADPGFGGALHASVIPGGSSAQGSVSGLAPDTTYYFRVGSLNWEGFPNFTALGSTLTAPAIAVTQTVSASGATLSLVPPYSPVVSRLTVIVPPGAFPSGTAVTLDATVADSLPPPGTNQGATTPMGAGIGFSLEAGALQPGAVITVVMVYDPLGLPASYDPKTLQLARYVPSAGQWSFLPTSVDAAQNTLTSRIDHFSFFAPFFVAAAAGVDGVNVYPSPWQPGGDNALFNAPDLRFSNLPAGARVRILTLSGESVWEGHAGSGGVLTWDGSNRYGRKAATGTYLALIEGQGKSAVRRVVLVR